MLNIEAFVYSFSTEESESNESFVLNFTVSGEISFPGGTSTGGKKFAT